MKIQSTLIKPSTQGNAIVELIVSADVVAGTPQIVNTPAPDPRSSLLADESIQLRMIVKLDHDQIRGVQGDAIKRAIEILESVRNQLAKPEGE